MLKQEQKTKSCTTCQKNLSCKTQLENTPCFGCSEHEAITPLSCPRSFSNEHTWDTSHYEEGKLTCLNCGLETTVYLARQARQQRDKGFSTVF
jgi:hypothetical protein